MHIELVFHNMRKVKISEAKQVIIIWILYLKVGKFTTRNKQFKQS